MKLRVGGWNDAPSAFDLHAEEEKSSTMELIFGKSGVLDVYCNFL